MRQAEKELRESEKRLQDILDNSTAVIYLKDPQGCYILVNRQFETLFHITREQLAGKTDYDLFSKEMADAFRANDQKALQAGAPLEFEEVAPQDDGLHVYISIKFPLLDSTGVAYGVCGISTDITERKQAEETLRKAHDELEARVAKRAEALLKANEELRAAAVERERAEEEYKTILRTAIDGFWLADTQGRFLDVNDAYCRLMGYSREELLRMRIPDVEAMETPEETARHIRRIIETGSDRFETRHRRKDGTIVDIEVSINHLEGDSGRLFVFLRDITERRRAEQEIRKLNADLARRAAELAVSNKELEGFSYSVAHDLRAPLRSIDGFSQAVLEDYGDKLDELGKDYLQRLRAASQRMGQLIDDVLSLSHLTRIEIRLETVDLSAIAQEIVAELRKTQPEREVELVIAPGLTVKGDPRLLRIALANLLGNAWKFTGNHPRARIELGVTEHEGKPAYFVRDDGVGFEMAYVGKLFAPFQRLHAMEEFPGTGVGLATVQRIIQRHGGRVWAEGAVEKGATFYFTL